MKQFIVLIFLLFSVFSSFSQTKQFEISGKIITADDKATLESATVYLERENDSTLITYTISDKDGKFTLEGRSSDSKLNLFVSYIGYKTYKKVIEVSSSKLDLGMINLEIDDNTLDAVLIKSRAPITIKKDTLEFNVKSFKTKKDANVEDLLKQLPGVEVDEAGQITVNGKPVNKILVNGKPFFGDDPTITTRNLTKEIIDKVQITDTKTKSEAFSGEQGDVDNKTINLTISEEKNKGIFGRVAAGGGTDDRYEYAGLFNYFDNDRRLSILSGGNNINSPGFSFGEIEKFFGGANSINFNSNGSFAINNRSFGGGQGITRSNTAGANYADDIGEKIEVTADYFFSNSNSENVTNTNRENILSDSRFFTNSNSNSINDSNNHDFNLGFDIEVDSTFLININPSFNYTTNENRFDRNQRSDDDRNVIELATNFPNPDNESSSNSFVETIGKNFRNDIDITKRFGNKGAFFKFSLTNEFDNIEVEDFLNSETIIRGLNPTNEIRNQFTDEDRDFNRLRTNITYRLPLKAKELFLDLRYTFENNKREELKSTFDFDNTTQDFTNFNQNLSTDFEFIDRTNTPSIRLRLQKEKWSISAGAGYVFRRLENSDQLRPNLSLNRDFEALELNSNFNYRLTNTTSINGGYNLRNRPPNISQLQPFQNVSDPLNTTIGNPNLEPINTHRANLGYHNFDFQKGTGIFLFLNADLVTDQVIAQTTVDENFVRNTTYVNVNGNRGVSGSASFSKTIKIDTLKTFKYRLGLFGNSRRTINFNNGIQYASINNSVTPNIRLTYTVKDIFEIQPNYRLSYRKTTFDINDFNDQEFLRHTVGLRTATFLPKGLEWRNDINYIFNPDVASGFEQNSVFWNSTLAYSILKDQGTLTLKVYDLLNQNTNAQRTANANFIQDSQSTVLQQYFLLSFSWKFNSLGKKGETNSNTFHIF
ncbi:TonB-dependent receptor [Flavobacteriaceae bacterium AU392]|nr:TonB-dependent receptor [Flavobacteriaceae bacterium]RKM86934.1 TonB-dependent receptor [Flavobacteriaceae bacterium AU392]